MHLIKRTTVMLAALATMPVFGQDIDAELLPEEEEPLRRYTVEVIVFRYAENVSVGTEVFLPDEPPPAEEPVLDEEGNPIDEELVDQLIEEVEEAIVEETVEEPELTEEELLEQARRYELVMLAEEELELLEFYEHIERLDVYEPLLHFGWTQPTLPLAETRSRVLEEFVTPPEGLSGEFSLYLERYLHLTVNLELDAEDTPVDTEVPEVEQEPVAWYDEAGYEIIEPQPVHYRIQEDRIFKNGDLRYFDHPRFGVLAKITRVEEEEEEPELDDTGEMLGDVDLAVEPGE